MSALDEILRGNEKRTSPEKDGGWIEYCILKMWEECDGADDYIADNAAAEAAALRERVAKLEEAIKPFAEIPCLENFDDDQLFDPAGGVLAGDVRKARAALRGEA